MSVDNLEPETTTLLIQFSKWPEQGRVKTRLAPLLGDNGALQAHIKLSRLVLSRLLATGLPLHFYWDRALASPPPESTSLLSDLTRAGVEQRFQRGRDLGARMEAALQAGLAEYSRVLIVGSDCPSVDADYVHAAQDALLDSDLVLGPSEDGGYVLIGVRRLVPGMLAGIEWGTGEVLTQTRSRAVDCGVSCRLLDTRWDVDEPEDWRRFLRQFPECGP
ncbi:TIGR04282 family arsenosugar biosynthesis glycosyltransferase [Marinobacter sp. SS21]|uniref:TIGR04282 family arsenosugar biosynthesis glycosyltransferase n=1 Tax=Marinobacter sp. SS21 TaxID=2979460 RepID=UPI0023309A17|nr:TIGR04282 family arsenosugar biosynthesis glycosyltransferase [Marinobacter sp. SS21]MDC0664232.1 TIGR04282 family arsenosugar biosynthesis glycosyltransferase [Marinobacter sp. SS21]